MQLPIFLASASLLLAVQVRANAQNDINEVCKPNLPGGGEAIICHRAGLSAFNRDDPVYDASFRNDGESICCSAGNECLLSRNSNEAACYNPSTKQARTATSSGTCDLKQSERTPTGKQCAFADDDILDQSGPGDEGDDFTDSVEMFTSISNGTGQVGTAESGAGPASKVTAMMFVLGAWTALGLL